MGNGFVDQKPAKFHQGHSTDKEGWSAKSNCTRPDVWTILQPFRKDVKSKRSRGNYLPEHVVESLNVVLSSGTLERLEHGGHDNVVWLDAVVYHPPVHSTDEFDVASRSKVVDGTRIDHQVCFVILPRVPGHQCNATQHWWHSGFQDATHKNRLYAQQQCR